MGSKQWWLLLTSLAGRSCRSRPAVPSTYQLAYYSIAQIQLHSTRILRDFHTRELKHTHASLALCTRIDTHVLLHA